MPSSVLKIKKNQQKFDGKSYCSWSKVCSLFAMPFVISYMFEIVCEVANLNLLNDWLHAEKSSVFGGNELGKYSRIFYANPL